MELMFEVIRQIFSLDTLIISFAGTLIGIILGAIPGMNGGIGIAVMLPFTYAMSPAVGLLFLGGMYLGSSYGGAITAILINCPGTSEAACTALEGYPMAQKGQGKAALYYSIVASSLGSFAGIFTLIFFTPILARVSVEFGPPEMMLLAVCGLTIVGSLTGKNVIKGLVATLIGLFMSMIGNASNTGLMRFTFGTKALQGGIDIIPAVIGLFAIAEMLKQGSKIRSGLGGETLQKLEDASVLDIFKITCTQHLGLLLKSSAIGTFIGVLPGTGGAIAAFLAYGEAKASSKTGGFGKGNPEGIVAAESANNAAVGGSLVPMLSLGIPGSPTSAIMFGALTIHGLVPGQRLFADHGDIAYTFLFGMLLTAVFMTLIGIFGIPLFSLILKIKLNQLIPIVIICSLVGAFSVQNSVYDLVVAVGCGLLGWGLSWLEIPTTPVVLGLILGRLIENNFSRTFQIAASKKIDFFAHIGYGLTAIVAACVVVYLVYAYYRAKRRGVGYLGFMRTSPVGLSILAVVLFLIYTSTVAAQREVYFFSYVFIRPISLGILAMTVYLIYANIKAIRREQAIKEDTDLPPEMLEEE